METVANLPHFFQKDEIIELIESCDVDAGELNRLAVAIGINTLLQKLPDGNVGISPRINSGERVKLIEKLP